MLTVISSMLKVFQFGLGCRMRNLRAVTLHSGTRLSEAVITIMSWELQKITKLSQKLSVLNNFSDLDIKFGLKLNTFSNPFSYGLANMLREAYDHTIVLKSVKKYSSLKQQRTFFFSLNSCEQASRVFSKDFRGKICPQLFMD